MEKEILLTEDILICQNEEKLKLLFAVAQRIAIGFENSFPLSKKLKIISLFCCTCYCEYYCYYYFELV
jgi:hypothetical protein